LKKGFVIAAEYFEVSSLLLHIVLLDVTAEKVRPANFRQL
jgi:hypothetical protein